MTEEKMTCNLKRVDVFLFGMECDIAILWTVISSIPHLLFSSNYFVLQKCLCPSWLSLNQNSV